MSKIDLLYKSLDEYLARLGSKFVDIYIPTEPSTQPSQYDLDVRSYCVLSHAAFEDFVEKVVIQVAATAVDNWIYRRSVSDVVIALLTWSGQRLRIDDDEKEPETRCVDYLRPLLEAAKKHFSKEVHKNHGVSKLYLRNLLIPVAIDLKSDVNLLNSLEKLAAGRGEYAHKGPVKTVMAPEDAKKYVTDILLLCDDVRIKANTNLK